MAKILLILLASIRLYSDPSIVFIHLGPKLPSYLPAAIEQARLFNQCPIYLIANERALKNAPKELEESRTILVTAESLAREPEHEKFLRMTPLDRVFRDGFWIFATERFFYLYECMLRFGLTDVFHLEYDNMLYADVSSILPIFQEHYPGKIAATFDNDIRCIAGFMYISEPLPLHRFLQFVVEKARTRNYDMEFLAQFKSVDLGAYIDHLPVVAPPYAEDHPLISTSRQTVRDPALYSKHFDAFGSIFDAAALGQYLGGEDPRNGPNGPGFINESCIFDPSRFIYEWIEDADGRLVPWIGYKQKKWPIVNLHIHCKDLNSFRSNR